MAARCCRGAPSRFLLRRRARSSGRRRRAWAFAHSLGVLHRDIKPANLFLHRGAEGVVVKIVDLGLAAFYKDRPEEDPLLTETCKGLGTPDFITPEQFSLQRDEMSAAMDLYSLSSSVFS